MTRPLLTVGMATYDDFHGAYFTLQSIALYHPDALSSIELLVIDNNPGCAHGAALRELIEKKIVNNGCHSARYIPAGKPWGTAAPRDRLFREAQGDVVLCLDSHVLVAPGALWRLMSFARGTNCDLWQGPLLNDAGGVLATHMQPVWRGEMFGTWAVDNRGLYPDADPFEIPMHGLGLFACRREAWLGFNPEFRGFGGEEGYIHAKYRRAGHRTLCLPWLRWMHRFPRPAETCRNCKAEHAIGGTPYALRRVHKARNYLIASKELGLPVGDVHRHFVRPGKLDAAAWSKICAEVYGYDPPLTEPTTPPEDATPDEFPAPWRLCP